MSPLYLNRRYDGSHLLVQTFVCRLNSGLTTTRFGVRNFTMPALLHIPQRNFGRKVSLVSYSYALANTKSVPTG